MEVSINFEDLDKHLANKEDDEVSSLVITATDDFQEDEVSEKNYISFNIETSSKIVRFLALKSDVRTFFEALKKNV